jgi:type IV secretion system protein TrbC
MSSRRRRISSRRVGHDVFAHFDCEDFGLRRRHAYSRSGLRSRVEHALGAAAPADSPVFEGPVSKIVAVIIIIVTGLTLAFGDTAGGFRRLIQIVFGLSIAFAASSFFLSFFSFGGGALI